jgi:signal transduction histidine kinase
MLADFLAENRDLIMSRARARLATRETLKPTTAELVHGLPVFLDQLESALRLTEATDTIDHELLSRSAIQHGEELHKIGLTVGQVVHDYGDVCQAITQVAVEKGAPIPSRDFQALNLALDDAIAVAVAEFARKREEALSGHQSERLAVISHELRTLVNTALLSFESIRMGSVTATGSTGTVHSRTLMGLRDLIDRSLADIRLEYGSPLFAPIPVLGFLEEVEITALVQSKVHGIPFSMTAPVDRTLTIEGDRQMLEAAMANMLQNAFRFSKKQSDVSLTTRATADRVLFEVKDACGVLPPGAATTDLTAYIEHQQTADRRNRRGLLIALKAAQANRGDIRITGANGQGCTLTLDLPRIAPG